MSEYRPWWPAAAVARAVADWPIERIVASWSAAWFVDAAATVRSAIELPVQPRGGGGWIADGLVVAPVEDAEARLSEMLFGAVPADAALTTADEAAVAAVVAACLADLRTRLATGIGLKGAVSWQPVLAGGAPLRCWEWRVDAGRHALLHVRADEAVIVRQARAALPATTGVPLTPLVAALAGQPVAVSALVGRSRVTTTELAQLTVGDVVVLDAALDTAAVLAVDRGATGAACTIAQHDDRLTLTLVDRETM